MSTRPVSSDKPQLKPTRIRIISLLGPAFVAAISYVDPGNVASNISAGADYGYLLLWVLVAASAMSVLLQYQSAKVGIITGKSLPALLGERITRPVGRYAFWLQAEVISIATDIAEIIGGAIAFNLLFHIPIVLAAILTSLIAMGLLLCQTARTQHKFELVMIGFTCVILIGFMLGLVMFPPDFMAVVQGLKPRFEGKDSLFLAASMMGATVMPHAIYAHSGLVTERFGKVVPEHRKLIIKATRIDVVVALCIAGSVNMGLLILAAHSLGHQSGVDTIEGAYEHIKNSLGTVIAVFFGLGLLASGIASSSVGTYAGAMVMEGLVHKRIPVVYRRILALFPAVIIVGSGMSSTTGLILSQVILSFGIPCAVIPLIRYSADRKLLGDYADWWGIKILSIISVGLIIALNVVLVYLQWRDLYG